MSRPLFELPLGAVRFLTVDQVAQMFKVTPRTVARWAAAGRVTGAMKTPGGHWRFPVPVVRSDAK